MKAEEEGERIKDRGRYAWGGRRRNRRDEQLLAHVFIFLIKKKWMKDSIKKMNFNRCGRREGERDEAEKIVDV